MTSPPRKMSKLSNDESALSMSSEQSYPTRQTSAPSPTSKLTPTTTTSSTSTSTRTTKKKSRLSFGSTLDKSGSKKLVLKAKPRASFEAGDYAAQSVITLVRAVRAIQSRPPQKTPESLQVLYTMCEAAVSAGPSTSQSLYDRVTMEIERSASELRRHLSSAQYDDLALWMSMLDEEWKRFIDQMLLIRSVFLHLDRVYIYHTPGLLPMWDLGMDIFRHSVVENEHVQPRMTDSLLKTIDKDRNGELVSQPLLRSLLLNLQELSAHSYSQFFVTPFLASSHVYYKAEASTHASSSDPSDYLKRVHRRLAEEATRCDTVIDPSLKGRMLRVVLDELAVGHVEAIIDRSLPEMLDQNRLEDLASIYSLMARTDSLPKLREAFLAYLKDTGLKMVMDKDQDDKMIPNLIAYRTRIVKIVRECFNNDADFTLAITQAFEFFVNKRENKPAEMMAKFLDAKMRAGSGRGIDDAEIESTLNDILYLFRFTQGKDMFEAFYKRDLAKRLLLNKSASTDAERSMLLKLKDECGPGFTQKLELMFKDMELSADVMQAWSQAAVSSQSPFGLSVAILSQGNWPSYPPCNPLLPDDMTSALKRFEGFYTSKHSGRKLTWQHSLDTCTLKAVFPKGGKKELNVSLYQAIVLLLFNGSTSRLSFEEIVSATRIEKKEAARTLQSLACGKVRVLQKQPKGREVEDGDTFVFNADFKHDNIRIRINQIQQKETVEENKSTSDRVLTDRSSHLQLAIVRIMKARKTVKHQELVMEVASQIGSRFRVESSEVKKAISSLIERDYMARSEEQQNIYEYVA